MNLTRFTILIWLLSCINSIGQLTITDASFTPTNVFLQWNSTGPAYIIEVTPSLSTGEWSYVSDVLSINEVVLSNDTEVTQFYRIREVTEIYFLDAVFESNVWDSIPIKYEPTNSLYDIDVEDILMLNVNGCGITNLAGIEHYTSLKTLHCWGNPLVTLDLSKNVALTNLHCWDTNLEELDLSANTNLLLLYSGGLFTNLDVSANVKLTILGHSGDYDDTPWRLPIYFLDVTANTNLIDLAVTENRFGTIDLTHNIKLDRLWCYNNKNLTNLDLSANIALREFHCHNSSLTNTLDLSANTNLVYVDVPHNFLTKIIVADTNNLPAHFMYDDGVIITDIKE